MARLAPEPRLPVARCTLLPAAFVASTAAAGGHAAMAPAHLAQQPLAGAFFVAAAAFQLVWAAGLVLGVSRRFALAGIGANLGLVVVWAASRTAGIPGLHDRPEPVGPWDVACVAWELVVVTACVRLLGTPRAPLARWHRWDERVSAFAVGSAAVLAALSFGGFGG